jgi:dTDP-glucose 4,6-dehydratase
MSLTKVVVTGGAGFIGSHLCRRLLSEQHAVVCVDNLITGSIGNIDDMLDHPRFTFVDADVTTEIPVEPPVTHVLHLASPASPVDYVKLPIETLMAGSVGTQHALELARRARARFLLASTSEVYGNPAAHPQPESYWGNVNPIGPRSMYDEAKRYAEALTTAYRQAHGVDTAIARIFNTYGPGMRSDDGRVVPTFITQALADHPLTVAGDGSQTRSLCYVDDLISGLIALLDADTPGPVNLGNPEEIAMVELAGLVRDVARSSSEIVFHPLPPEDPTRRRPDTTLAWQVLRWAPQVGLHAGLQATVAWFHEKRTPLGPNGQHDLTGYHDHPGSAEKCI